MCFTIYIKFTHLGGGIFNAQLNPSTRASGIFASTKNVATATKIRPRNLRVSSQPLDHRGGLLNKKSLTDRCKRLHCALPSIYVAVCTPHPSCKWEAAPLCCRSHQKVDIASFFGTQALWISWNVSLRAHTYICTFSDHFKLTCAVHTCTHKHSDTKSFPSL